MTDNRPVADEGERPTRSFGPLYETPGEMEAYHRGQRDALDAVIAHLMAYMERGKNRPKLSDHPCYLAARRGEHRGIYYALGRVRHFRLGANINQRIKAIIGHAPPERAVLTAERTAVCSEGET